MTCNRWCGAKLELVHPQLADLLELDRRCFNDPYSERVWRSYLERPDRFYLCAFSREQMLVGYACFSVLEPEAELLRVGVLPEYRSAGVAYAGLGAVQQQLASRGIERLLLEVRESNQAARKLYQSLGYVNDGRRSGYYPSEADRPAEDALLLSLNLK